MKSVPSTPRAARIQLNRVDDLLAHLRMSRLALLELEHDTSSVDTLIQEVTSHKNLIHQVSKLPAESRVRQPPRVVNDLEIRPTYTLYMDECGSHVTSPINSTFPVFCLSGVVIADDDYLQMDRNWKNWKQKVLGSWDVIVHEPDVRHRTHKFRGETPEHGDQIEDSLDEFLADAGFLTIAAAVDLRAFVEAHPTERVDEYLPKSCYLMCIDLLLERFIHFLQHQASDARGNVVAESRGAKEDALVHAEFIRLHLEGTQFVSESYFRNQLRPYVEFFRKRRNSSGLQLADLVARPIAEKILRPQTTPRRWDIIKPKLSDGGKGEPHKYGLKVFPLTATNDPFPEFGRQAKRDA